MYSCWYPEVFSIISSYISYSMSVISAYHFIHIILVLVLNIIIILHIMVIVRLIFQLGCDYLYFVWTLWHLYCCNTHYLSNCLHYFGFFFDNFVYYNYYVISIVMFFLTIMIKAPSPLIISLLFLFTIHLLFPR